MLVNLYILDKDEKQKAKYEINVFDFKINIMGGDSDSNVKSSNINFYKFDKISDIKRKIFLLSGIPLYKQYLFIKQPIQIPLFYKITSIGYVNMNIFAESEKILDIPIDLHMYKYNNDIKLLALDELTLFGEIETKELFLISLDEYFNEQSYLLLTDSLQIQMIYYGFILKYFPMCTLEIFKMYLNKENIQDVYPDIVGNYNEISYIYKAENELLQYKEYNELSINLKSVKINCNNKCVIDIDVLFNTIVIDDQIVIMKYKTLLSRVPVIYTKFENNIIQDIYDIFKDEFNTISLGTIMLIIKCNDSYALLSLKNSGDCSVYFNMEFNISLGFNEIYKLISTYINPVIQKINNLGRVVYKSSTQLKLMNKYNSEINNLHISFNWKKPFNETKFKAFYEYMKSIYTSNIINKLDIDGNIITFYLIKGIVKYNWIDNESINGYDYLINGKNKEKWNEMYKGRKIVIQNRTFDINIDVFSLHESEFNYVYTLIQIITNKFQKHYKVEIKDKFIDLSKGALKTLKSADPQLFDFNHQDSSIVYSRICQKKLQPMIYSSEEYKKLENKKKDKAVKFWNFTNKSDAYYVCPNPQYPYLNFIVGQHPDNFCLPCCKKTPSIDIKTKKNQIYNICINEHVYNENENDTDINISRYIMNYGKQIEIARISKLPEILEKYIYNNQEINENTWKYNNKIYSLDMIRKITAYNKVYKEQLYKYKSVYSTVDMNNSEIKNQVISMQISPIIVLKNDPLTVVDNKYLLKKAEIEGLNEIDIVHITDIQLEKSIKNESDNKNIKKRNLYLYGAQQNMININNVGAIYCLSFLLNLNIEDYITECYTWLKANEKDYSSLLYNTITKYYSYKDFINVFANTFIHKMQFNSIFNYWNEIFIELTRRIYNKYTIMYVDDNVEFSEANNLSICIPESINNINTVFNNNEFFILMKKKKKSKNILHTEYIYYPIVILSPYLFFKNMNIEKKSFSKNDILIKILQNFDITQNIITFDFSIFSLFANENKIDIVNIWKNYKNLIHGVTFIMEKQKITIPLYYSNDYFINTIKGSLPKNNISYHSILNFIYEYNEFIVLKSELEKLYNSYVNKTQYTNSLNKREMSIIAKYPLLKIDYFLIYNNQLIGFQCNELPFTFTPIEIYNKNGSQIDIFGKKYENYNFGNCAIKYIYYDFNIINRSIESELKTPSKPIISNERLKNALMSKYGYKIHVSKIMQSIDNERNVTQRKKIIEMLNNININDKITLDEQEDNDILQEMISRYKYKHFNKKILIEEFENNVYNFDRNTINKISKLDNVNDIITILNKINSHNEFNKMLANDFLNPIKRKYLLNGIVLDMSNNYFSLKKNKNENVYIKFE